MHHPIEADHTEEADHTGTQVEVLHAETGQHTSGTEAHTPYAHEVSHIILTNPKPSSDTDDSVSHI